MFPWALVPVSGCPVLHCPSLDHAPHTGTGKLATTTTNNTPLNRHHHTVTVRDTTHMTHMARTVYLSKIRWHLSVTFPSASERFERFSMLLLLHKTHVIVGTVHARFSVHSSILECGCHVCIHITFSQVHLSVFDFCREASNQCFEPQGSRDI